MTATRNTKTLLYGIFATDSLMDDCEDVALSILYDICKTIKDKNGVDVGIITNYLKSKKDTITFDPNDGAVLVYSSPLIFANMFDSDPHDIDILIEKIVSITNNNHSIEITEEYLRLLHDFFWQSVGINEILDILPELDVLESEVIASLSIKDVFFAALWCLTMSNSYEYACKKAAKLENTNSYIIEVTGALAGMYYGLESIPKNWISTAEEKYDVSAIVF